MKRINIIIATLCLISLLSFIYTVYLIEQRNRQIKFTDYSFVTNNTNLEDAHPVLIEIPVLELSLPIIQTSINNYEWEVTSEGIAYLRNTALPGTEGNSVFYGHNWSNLLGNLNKVNYGDEITIVLSDGSRRTFMIKDKFIVTPDQTHILNNREGKILTLYTCTGFMDSKRLVVVAELI